ncbi:MAG: hypothetical protein C0502_00915 [Opitutus sp.]|nr:hypothetical protein [Opitutus sp.]
MNETAVPTSRWAGAWPDALAFATGLALARVFRWETRDLVWSLWLSSLLVGYAMILWSIFSPVVVLKREGRTGGAIAALAGGLFTLLFFTFHFGMFHFVHSAFLNGFFPVADKPEGFPEPSLYAEVLARYWWFVPVALLAERQAFKLQPAPPEPPPTSVKAADIAQRKARQAHLNPTAGAMQPYKNVVRLHLLIFFFAGAHFAKLDSFLVYSAVYAAYFFPWRLLQAGKAA